MGVLDGRIIAVTGASRGIGYHAARALAANGANIIAIARTVGGLEQLDDDIREAGGKATLVPLDVTDYEGIDRLGASIAQRWGRLDGFLGNAAILGSLSPTGHYDIKTFDQVMATNFTANWRFLRSFDPLFRQSENARIVLMSAGIVADPKAFTGLYAASKSALESLGKAYARENKNTNIVLTLLRPGIAATAMRAQVMPGEDSSLIPHPKTLADPIGKLLSPENNANGQIYDVQAGGFVT